DVYVANKRPLENKPLAEVRKVIVDFLRRDYEQKAIDAYLETLKTKYRFVAGKDVNSPALRPTDVLFSIAGKPLRTSEFESKNKVQLNEALADIIDDVIDDLQSSILSTLVAAEAKSQNLETSAFIGREITDKLREFSDDERSTLEGLLKNRLFA